MLRRPLTLLLLLGALSAHAQTTLSVILPLVPPSTYLDPAGRLSGFSVEVVRAIAKQAGFALDIQLAPANRGIRQLKENGIDLTITPQSPETGRPFQRVAELIQAPVVIWARTTGHALADWDGKRIGRLRTGCEELAPRPLALIDLNSYVAGVKMLENGELDALCGGYNSIRDSARKAGKSHVLSDQPFVLSHQTLTLVARPGLPAADLARLRQGAQWLKDSGELDRIVRRYNLHTR